MSNNTGSSTSKGLDALFGQDVLWWGNNEYYQLGTGKRNNVNVPSYIPPLEGVGPREEASVETKSGEARAIIPLNRLQVTPRRTGVLGDGRKATMEQRVVAGPFISAIYSKV